MVHKVLSNTLNTSSKAQPMRLVEGNSTTRCHAAHARSLMSSVLLAAHYLQHAGIVLASCSQSQARTHRVVLQKAA